MLTLANVEGLPIQNNSLSGDCVFAGFRSADGKVDAIKSLHPALVPNPETVKELNNKKTLVFLQNWSQDVTLRTYRQLFTDAAAQSNGRILFAENSLDTVDSVSAEIRFRDFMENAASGLSEYANQGASQGLHALFKSRKVTWTANSGTVAFSYNLDNQMTNAKTTKQHLLQHHGPGVPRVYFDTAKNFVVVLYCGPHPTEDTTYQATVRYPS